MTLRNPISITAVKAAITEGETASFTVQRSGGSAPQSVPVGVALEGDLVAAATRVSGVSVTDGATIPVRFEADETSVTVAVPTVADDMDEIDGAITLFVRAAQRWQLSARQSTAGHGGRARRRPPRGDRGDHGRRGG